MPDERPSRPVPLNATPRTKGPPRSKPPRRPRKNRPKGERDTLLYWVAGLLVVVLIALVAIALEADEIKAWFTGAKPTPAAPSAPVPELKTPPPVVIAPPAPAPEPPVVTNAPPLTPPTPPPLTEAERKHQLEEKADAETRKLEQETAAGATNAAAALPPIAQPVVPGAVHGAPARALPLDPNVLTTERIAAYQVALERIHFSCGFVDGDQGMRTQRMLRAFQLSRGLPQTGFLDPATRAAIGEPGEPFLTYTVTADDVASIMPKPPTWRDKAKATRLGYNDIWELLAEKFHCTRGYLKQLNRGVTQPVAGTEIIGPKVYPAAHLPQAASLRIYLGETSLEALDAGGHIIAFFPCSIAKDKNKRPHGLLTVKVVDDHPDYTFDPALFVDAAKAEGITHKLTIPPGPRNPVGTTWVGLSLPGYGIHGTPDPEAVSRTQSHGCFRLANWNAEKVLKMVRIGTPVDVEP